ncbi:glycosyltransferase family 4 protein [Halopenitus sp. H-Gu1]|uniref:glycosyltransferase family 4 protein n=1 Tax=Halopenitus sp. H-Gu1 TaxID=3242697 RepID=UPI00359D6467
MSNMIQVGINGRVLAKPRPGGVGRYTRRLLGELGAGSADTYGCSPVAVGAEEVSDLPDGVEAEGAVPASSGPRAHLWEQVTLPRMLAGEEYDVFHTPAGNPPVLSGTPLVTTIHDISPITHPEWFTNSYVSLYRLLTPLAVRTSDRIITVSKFARDEIIDVYPVAEGKIEVIYNGVRSRDPTDSEPVDDLAPDRFLLFVGSTNPRKNLEGLLNGYRRYRQNTSDPYSLVLVGPDNDVFASTNLPTVNGVRRLGFVSEPQLTWLYDAAALFVFPSLYEGFGLPILEAMSRGTPVITSDCGAMAEISGNAAHLVSPTDPGTIADGIEYVLDDTEYRQAISQQGKHHAADFTWSRTARQTAELYHSVADRE